MHRIKVFPTNAEYDDKKSLEEAFDMNSMLFPVVPKGRVDVVLDTDTNNEIDDQFAVAYLLRSDDRLNCEAFYAAPFSNPDTPDPADGMQQSYEELFKILRLCGREDKIPVCYRGSDRYLPNEREPVISDAAKDLVTRAMKHTAEDPLYVIAIGAITNVASAFLMEPSIADRVVVVWLGGHALHWKDTQEFNMFQDIAAARVVFANASRLVQLPCNGVVSSFTVSEADLEKWLVGANPLCDYLASNTIRYENRWNKGRPWAKQIWDVTAVAWLLNDDDRFMEAVPMPVHMPEYDFRYGLPDGDRFLLYVRHINRTALMDDLFRKLRQ